MIEFRDVNKAFPDGTEAIASLSLTAADGEITVLVGPSGCGKTTSLRMINRMLDPTSGQVLLDGADVADQDPARLRRGIGYVIQHAGLFPHRSVLDNVATVPVLQGVSRREARSRAGELLERVGLDPAVGSRYPSQLSGGQQQRVGVARALAGDAPVLLMDEPFSAVDPVVRADLQAELLRLQSELGKTIVFVTHDIDEAIRLGDRVAVLRVGGRLAQFDAPAELLAHPVDDFVASFVGRDRGYRRLGFVGAGELALTDVATTRDGAAAGDGTAAGGGRTTRGSWTVLVDAEGRPTGWLPPGGGPAVATGSLHHASAPVGQSAAGEGGSLRSALDAALSSPAEVGLAVDEHGRVLGGVDADAVLALVDAARERASAVADAGPGATAPEPADPDPADPGPVR